MAEYGTECESASMTVRRMEQGFHEFVVENYSLCKGIGVNQAIESEHFTVGGYNWAIRFYPDGRDEDACKNGDISLFILLKSECTATVRILYDLCLVDQSGGGNDWDRTFLTGDPTNCCQMNGLTDFIDRVSLEEPSVYLKDDCLKIRCTIGVLLSFESQNLPIIEIPKPNIGADFGKLLENGRGADVFFKVAGESFRAHKCILAARSPEFWSRLSNARHQRKHGEIVIPNVEPRVFKAMLRFVYTGTLLEEEDREACADNYTFVYNSFLFLGRLLGASDRFELKSLKSICESRIFENVCAASVSDVARLADVCHATQLKAACLRFAAENKAAVMESVVKYNGSKYLEESYPFLFLEVASDQENLDNEGRRELGFCRKILNALKGKNKKKKKIKEL